MRRDLGSRRFWPGFRKKGCASFKFLSLGESGKYMSPSHGARYILFLNHALEDLALFWEGVLLVRLTFGEVFSAPDI